MLISKHKQNCHERELLHQTLQTKEVEYRELYAASEDLYSQLQETLQRCNKHDAELEKSRGNFSKFKQQAAETHHELETARETIEDQKTQLLQGKSLLVSERERNNRLEGEVAKFTTIHTLDMQKLNNLIHGGFDG